MKRDPSTSNIVPVRPKRSREGGFTLMELMIVVVILGILAAAFFPDLMGYVDTARSSEAEKNSAWLAENIETFINQRPRATVQNIMDALDSTNVGNLNPDGDAANQITTLIPALKAQPSWLFRYELDVYLSENRQTKLICVKAIYRADPERYLLFSNIPSSALQWEGNVQRSKFIDKSVALVPGGACQADGTVATENLG